MLPPSQIKVKIHNSMQSLWLEKGFYANNGRMLICAFDYPEIFDVITYNLPDVDLAFNEIVVPVTDRHTYNLLLLLLITFFEDTKRRVRTGYIDCQIWRMKQMSEAHR